MNYDCIAIGAGISGLAAARVLHGAGHKVILLDKGRRVGGRVCARTFAGKRVDYGAQYFTARSALFQGVVEEAIARDAVQEWRGVFQDQDYPRYIGTNGIRTLPEFLAGGLDVRLETEVTGCEEVADSWRVHRRQGEPLSTRALVLTTPIPQLLKLMPDTVRATVPQLEIVGYHKTLAAMLSFDDRFELPGGVGGIRKSEGRCIGWIGDNGHKYRAEGPTCLTIHCAYAYSKEMFAAEKTRIIEDILAELEEDIAGLPGLRECYLHRWRYAEPRTILPDAYVIASEYPLLALAGEAFAGPRVEGAFLSGHKLGEALLDLAARSSN